MIPDWKTNYLYLADTLPKFYSKFYAALETILIQNEIVFELIPGTSDVWAVDYMPIQFDEDQFIQFIYNPSYLQSRKYLKTISDVDAICNTLGINSIKSNIVIDGGNIVRSSNAVILTERIFKENPTFERKQLIKELQIQLQVEKVIIIPEQPNDFTGHADGMVRFLDDNTVLMNDYKNENMHFINAFENTLKQAELNFLKIPYNPYSNAKNMHANGIYINYLQMARAIIIPTFNQKEDDLVVRQFEQIFKGFDIATIDGNDLAKQGGLLNCISWNIYK